MQIQIAKILPDQPDDSSYDELLQELAFARMIDRGSLTLTQERQSAMKREGAASRHGRADVDR